MVAAPIPWRVSMLGVILGVYSGNTLTVLRVSQTAGKGVLVKKKGNDSRVEVPLQSRLMNRGTGFPAVCAMRTTSVSVVYPSMIEKRPAVADTNDKKQTQSLLHTRYQVLIRR